MMLVGIFKGFVGKYLVFVKIKTLEFMFLVCFGFSTVTLKKINHYGYSVRSGLFSIF